MRTFAGHGAETQEVAAECQQRGNICGKRHCPSIEAIVYGTSYDLDNRPGLGHASYRSQKERGLDCSGIEEEVEGGQRLLC